MKVLSWNVRGLRGDRIPIVARYLAQWKPDICFLQETHIEEVDDFKWKSFENCQLNDKCYLPSLGRSGGQLIMWNKDLFVPQDTIMGRYCLSCVLS